MLEIKGKINTSDLDHIKGLGHNPVVAMPCPINYFGGGEYDGNINPHVTRFLLDSGDKLDIFHIKPIYYLHKNGQWRPMEEVCNYFGNKNIDLKADWGDKMDVRYLKWLIRRMEIIRGSLTVTMPTKDLVTVESVPLREGKEIFFTTSTFYPDPDPESTSVDGRVRRGAVNETFAQIISGAGQTATSDGTSHSTFFRGSATTDQFDFNERMIFLFDTSALPDGDTISSAEICFYSAGKLNGLGGDGCTIVETNPDTNTALVPADYGTFGSVAFASETYSGWDTSAYNNLTLNSSGVANISKTGVSKFGLLHTWDFDESFGGTWASGGTDYMFVTMSDASGTGTDPKLVVVHAEASTFTPKVMIF